MQLLLSSSNAYNGRASNTVLMYPFNAKFSLTSRWNIVYSSDVQQSSFRFSSHSMTCLSAWASLTKWISALTNETKLRQETCCVNKERKRAENTIQDGGGEPGAKLMRNSEVTYNHSMASEYLNGLAVKIMTATTNEWSLKFSFVDDDLDRRLQLDADPMTRLSVAAAAVVLCIVAIVFFSICPTLIQTRRQI